MNFSKMNLAKTCVFNIKCVFIAKITSILQKNLRKEQNIKLVGVSNNLIKKTNHGCHVLA
jgi:hypothetical protein